MGDSSYDELENWEKNMDASGTSERTFISSSQQIICWSRMQAEAGQRLPAILARKERERLLGKGIFFWGVGNSPSTWIPELACKGIEIPVWFSLMKSKPKARDVAPDRTFAWRLYIDAQGVTREIPEHVLVTSRASARSFHCALICHSDEPLTVANHGRFDPSAYRNVGDQGGPVGSSQVTALIRQTSSSIGGDYEISMRARLSGSYWVRLVDPIEIDTSDSRLLDAFIGSNTDWLSLVKGIKEGLRRPAEISRGNKLQYNLFQM